MNSDFNSEFFLIPRKKKKNSDFKLRILGLKSEFRLIPNAEEKKVRTRNLFQIAEKMSEFWFLPNSDKKRQNSDFNLRILGLESEFGLLPNSEKK